MEKDAINALEAFRQGDVDAFEALFRLHQRAVYAWILRIVRMASIAEELTAESFLRIYQARARFNPAYGFEGWARRIATRVALDWMRTAHVDLELPAEIASAEKSDAAVTAEIRREVLLALNRLPPKLRIAAMLAVVEERPQKEVAQALGISVAAVKVRVFRALRLLRKDLERAGIKP